MACGKTTFGRALAKELSMQFIDLDFYIEQRFRMSIARIFEQRGEAGFRDMESRMLREVGEFEDVVVSCGGGTPCFCGNMDYMLSRGLTVWLTASVERITDRLVINNAARPLMRGKNRAEIELAVVAGLEQRTQVYSRALIHFSGENLEDRRQISTSVGKFSNEFIKNPGKIAE